MTVGDHRVIELVEEGIGMAKGSGKGAVRKRVADVSAAERNAAVQLRRAVKRRITKLEKDLAAARRIEGRRRSRLAAASAEADRIRDEIAHLVGHVSEPAVGGARKVGHAAGDLLEGAADAVTDAAGGVVRAAGSAVHAAAPAGEAVMEAAHDAADAVRGAAQSVVGAARRAVRTRPPAEPVSTAKAAAPTAAAKVAAKPAAKVAAKPVAATPDVANPAAPKRAAAKPAATRKPTARRSRSARPATPPAGADNA